jgi:hypothetical protein
LVAVIADAADRDFVIAIRALTDFRYLAQRKSLTESDLTKLTASLKEFHDHKQAILDARVRLGSKKNIINDFCIPKLELLQSLTPSTRLLGVAIQWSTDVTEHCNITLIKEPARSGNNKNYDIQICRHLDRMEKARLFDLTTSLRQATSAQSVVTPATAVESDDEDDDSGSERGIGDSRFIPTVQVASPTKTSAPTNYFLQARKLLEDPPPWTPRPLRTFSTPSTGFHLTHRANKTRMTIDEAAITFGLPDLRPALADYVQRLKIGSHFTHKIGGRRTAGPTALLPFKEVQVWYGVRMQMPVVDNPSLVMPPETVHTCPPSKGWPCGRYDTVLISNNPDVRWPGCGITGTSLIILICSCSKRLSIGHSIVQPRIIFCPYWVSGAEVIDSNFPYLAYCQRLDIVPQTVVPGQTAERVADPVSGMFIVKRALRADGTRVGDIVPLSRLRVPVELIPRFGKKADARLTPQNSLEYTSEFYLNKYSDKEIFYSVF